MAGHDLMLVCMQAAVQLSVAIILLLCGGAITKLQSTDRMNSTRIPWDTSSLLYAAARGSPAVTTQSNSTSTQPTSLFNLSTIISALQGPSRGLAAADLAGSNPAGNVTSAAWVLDASTINDTYAACAQNLPHNCTAAVKASIGSDLAMSFGHFISWNSTADYLLKEGTVRLPNDACLCSEKCEHK